MILVPELEQYGQIAGAGLGILFLKYGRDDERQSDELGFRYALEAGYDVREMAEVFASLERASELAGAGSLPTWLSSHPGPPERIEAVQARVEGLDRSLDGLRVGREAYLPRLDGLVHGADPRNGFFRDGRFIHPDLRFEMALPAGWQGQNLPEMVAATSPEQDAVVQLTLAGESPSAAARTFLAQDGVTGVRTSRGEIHGFDALAVEFTAAGDTPLRGVATFLADGERTYRLLGYAAASVFDRYAGVIQAWAGSYRRLTDPELLAVEPDRIAIVELPSAMTLAEFADRYPSVVPLEELALLNQVPDGSAPLGAGRLMKRVVRR